MAGNVESLDFPPLSQEELLALILKNKESLIADSEAKRNDPNTQWSQPSILPISFGGLNGESVGAKLAMPQFLKDLFDAFTLPGEVAQGQVSQEDAYGRAANFAFNMGTSGTVAGTSQAAKEGFDPNLLSIFAGRNSKTADLKALDEARKMALALEDPSTGKLSRRAMDTIFRETGWFPGPDGRWRYEIPDNPAPGPLMPNFDLAYGEALRALAGKEKAPSWDQITASVPDMSVAPVEGTLSQLIDHPKLFAAYPWLKDQKATVQWAGQQEGHAYPGTKQSIAAAGATTTDVMSVLLHEIQHLLQWDESFANGGSPRGMKNVLANIAPHADTQLQLADPYLAYRALMGETEARAVQNRYEFGTSSLMKETPTGWEYDTSPAPYWKNSPYLPPEGEKLPTTMVGAAPLGMYEIPVHLQIDPRYFTAPSPVDQVMLLDKLKKLKSVFGGSL